MSPYEKDSERKLLENTKRNKQIATYTVCKWVNIKERQPAELQIIEIVQNEAFQDKIQLLKDANI